MMRILTRSIITIDYRICLHLKFGGDQVLGAGKPGIANLGRVFCVVEGSDYRIDIRPDLRGLQRLFVDLAAGMDYGGVVFLPHEKSDSGVRHPRLLSQQVHCEVAGVDQGAVALLADDCSALDAEVSTYSLDYGRWLAGRQALHVRRHRLQGGRGEVDIYPVAG